MNESQKTIARLLLVNHGLDMLIAEQERDTPLVYPAALAQEFLEERRYLVRELWRRSRHRYEADNEA